MLLHIALCTEFLLNLEPCYKHPSKKSKVLLILCTSLLDEFTDWLSSLSATLQDPPSSCIQSYWLTYSLILWLTHWLTNWFSSLSSSLQGPQPARLQRGSVWAPVGPEHRQRHGPGLPACSPYLHWPEHCGLPHKRTWEQVSKFA